MSAYSSYRDYHGDHILILENLPRGRAKKKYAPTRVWWTGREFKIERATKYGGGQLWSTINKEYTAKEITNVILQMTEEGSRTVEQERSALHRVNDRDKLYEKLLLKRERLRVRAQQERAGKK